MTNTSAHTRQKQPRLPIDDETPRGGLTPREVSDLYLALKTARELLAWIEETLTSLPHADR